MEPCRRLAGEQKKELRVFVGSKEPTATELKRKGFTLVELLVTIAVLAILMAVVVVVIDPAARFEAARISNAGSVMVRLAGAMEACYIVQEGKAAPGGYANCDTLAELKAGGFLKSGFTLPIDMSYRRADPTNNWYRRFIRNVTADKFCIMFWHGPENWWQSYLSERSKLGFGYSAAECPGGWVYFN